MRYVKAVILVVVLFNNNEQPIVGVCVKCFSFLYEKRAVSLSSTLLISRREIQMKIGLNPVDPAGGCGSLVCT